MIAAPGSESPAARRRRVVAIAAALEKEYALPHSPRAKPSTLIRPGAPPAGKPLDVLIATILSQNTSDVNSGLAWARLRERFPSWNQVADADVRAIAAAIRPGGLSNVKAPRIKHILRHIGRERGRLSLDFLAHMSDGEARDYLLALPGVGLKTANVVLLFALDRQVFPVDTHVLRVARRLGLIGPKVCADRAHGELEPLVPPPRRRALHLNLIAHGRQVCKARCPQCPRCPLDRAALCPYPRRERRWV
ncbi:MAG TPA: endonuclease III [Armatimonadota bacterium]|nr:endonuclease III [Armatimonadota bacterium]